MMFETLILRQKEVAGRIKAIAEKMGYHDDIKTQLRCSEVSLTMRKSRNRKTRDGKTESRSP